MNESLEKIMDDLKISYKKMPSKLVISKRTAVKNQKDIDQHISEMLKKIPTYFLYNSRSFIFLFIHLLKLLARFNKDITLLNITKSYRKSNPGFSHGDFMWRPSNSLLKSMYENFSNYSDMEKNYAKTCFAGISHFPSFHLRC